jgi:AcrR family transcriptional regulator
MGRPSLAEPRRAQILDAYEECILQHGMEGSSLEKIAEQAGMKRSVVRHYLGNRGQLRRALVDRVIERNTKSYLEAIKAQGQAGGLEALIGYIAGPEFPDERDDALIDALFAASHRDPDLRAQLRGRYVAFQRSIAGELRVAFPGADGKAIRRMAYALVCLAYGSASMQDLGLPSRDVGDAREAARAMVIGVLGQPARRPPPS